MNQLRQSIPDILAQALELPEADRPAFLEKACEGDQQVQQRVERLLAAAPKAAQFLESAAIGCPPTIGTSSTPAVGSHIGPYKLLEQIGEGGMGVVYMAQQTQPVKRKVALKVVKPGMDSRQVVARFEAERQALALMDHAHIARVLDAGTTDFGRPYFVMELVRGVPITEYCDRQRLKTTDRLKLFIDVCHAVQHAHLRGIIHRDLKPSNVLVTLHDGVPVVKVIDFGVAKAIGQELTERTLFTHFAQMIGTPLYMSPEQAELSGLDIDTRTDVYSLGVLLYELLTGTTPFDKEHLSKVSFDEMRRIIREDEPDTVSARLAKTRRVGSAHHTPLLLGEGGQRPGEGVRHSSSLIPSPQPLTPRLTELDWIVSKSLEKDRTRRYESASSFAADIQRYLSDEPVLACPPTTMYRFQKFARKHKPALAAALAIVASLLVGSTVSAWQAVRATTAEAQANANAIQAQEKAKEVTAQRDEAQKQRDEVKALADKLAAKEDELQRTLYADHIDMAKAAWDGGNVGRVTSLLSQHRPKPDEPDRRGFEWHYLNRLSHIGPLLSIKTQTLGRQDVTLSPDRTRLISVIPARTRRVDGKPVISGPTLHVVNLQTGQEVLTAELPGFQPNSQFGQGSRFSPDATLMATNSSRWDYDKQIYILGEVKVWNTQTGKEVFSRNSVIESVAFSPDSKLLVSAMEDQTVKLWDLQTGQERLTFKGELEFPHAFAFSPDGKRLAAAGNKWDKTKKASVAGEIKIWDVQTGEQVQRLNGHTDWMTSLVYSPDGQRLASCTEGTGTIKLWDPHTGSQLRALELGAESVFQFKFNADGSRLIGDGYKKENDDTVYPVKLWNVQTGQEMLSINNATLEFSPDGKRVAAADWHNSRTKVFDAHSGQLMLSVSDAGGKLAFSPDSKRLATQSGGMRIWDLQTGDEVNHIKGFDGGYILAFSSDGKRLIGVNQTAAQVWEVDVEQRSGKQLTLAGVSRQSASIRGDSPSVFSSDFTRIVGISGKSVKIFDVQTGQVLRTLTGHKNNVMCVAFSPDGKRVASCDAKGRRAPRENANPGEVKIWDADSGSELLAIGGIENTIAHLAFSPDGKKLAASFGDCTLKLWEAQSGRELHTLGSKRETSNSIFSMFAFSPDGKRIAGPGVLSNETAPDGRRIVGAATIWDAETGQEVVTLKGARDIMAFSPDGKRVIVGGGAGLENVFDAETGEPISAVPGGGRGWVTYSPDGKRLASSAGICDAQTGQELLRFGSETSGHIAFSPDGHRLGIVKAYGNEVTIYDATPLPEEP